MDRDVLRPKWSFLQFKKLGPSEKIPSGGCGQF